MSEDWSAYVPDVYFEKIPIRNLVSNQEYQRKLSYGHVSKTADNFNLYQINPVKVSRRDGINYVFNGQHTIETVARVSGSRETPVWCMIYENLDYEIEAAIFAEQQKYNKALTPYDVFKAHLEAGHDAQLTILRIVESYGLAISSSKQAPNCVCAISALEFIYNNYGFHILDQTLYITVSTWEGDPFSLAANMLKGIAKLLVVYEETLKGDLFVERLSRVSAKEITRLAKERRNGSLGFAEALLTFYNRKTRYPLKWGKLYNGKGDDNEEPELEHETGDEERELDDASSQLSFASLPIVEGMQPDELGEPL